MRTKEQVLADIEKAKSQLEYAANEDQKDFINQKIDNLYLELEQLEKAPPTPPDKKKSDKKKKPASNAVDVDEDWDSEERLSKISDRAKKRLGARKKRPSLDD